MYVNKKGDKEMNIAMVTRYYPPDVHGGGEISCKLLVDNLLKMGHTVDVFEINKIFPKIKSKIYLNKKTYKYLKRNLKSYDIVHTYNMYLLPCIGELTKKEKINSYATFNGIVFSPSLSIYNCKMLSPKFYRNKIYFNKIKNIRMFSTLCEYWRRKWIQDGIPENKISVITNMIDRSFPVLEKEKDDFFNILHIGNYSLTREKEIIDVIKIFSKFKKQKIKLTLVGSGISKKQKIIKKYKPKNKIDIVGPINNKQISQYYSKADVFLHPSILPKGNDRVIIEAMQHGCVVLTHCSDELSPIITHNDDGILIENNEIDAYYKNIKSLIDKKSKYKKLSTNAKKNIYKKCSPEIITKKYVKRYEMML